MRKSVILAITLLAALVLLVGMGAVACNGNGDENGAPPEDGEEVAPPEEEDEAAPVLPKLGEWVASTGSSQFTFTFTVSPDGAEISQFWCEFEEFGFCGGYRVGKLTSVADFAEPIHLLPSGAEFSFVYDIQVYRGRDEDPLTGIPGWIHIYWHIVIEGKFDETGTQASGTWEISSAGKVHTFSPISSPPSSEGTVCLEGTWEASH